MRDLPFNPEQQQAVRAREPESASSAGVETGADRRRSPRATHRVVFNIYPLSDGGSGNGGAAADPVEVVLQDLSLVGMGIIHSTALSRGSRYQIPLVRGDEADVAARRAAGEPQALLATVVRCEQLDDGLFSIGFEFNSSADAVDQGSRQLTGHPAPRE